MPPTIPLEQAMDKAQRIAALKDELDRLHIAHDHADGALADATTVPTGDLERGIRALTKERDGLRDDLQVANQIGDSFWAALKPRLPEAIYVSNPGRHFTELLDAAEADVKALAEALIEIAKDDDLVVASGGAWTLNAYERRRDIARAALTRDGVRRRRGEGT